MHFKRSFQKGEEEILDIFIERYIVCINILDPSIMESVIERYKKILHCFYAQCEEEDILSAFEGLAKMKIERKIPYTALSNEMYGLKNLLLEHSNLDKEGLKAFLELFYKANNRIAKLYLQLYLENLIHANNIRIASLKDISEINIIRFFKKHLLWLNTLAKQIKQNDPEGFPELDETKCEFGAWLQNEANVILQNNSKQKALVNLHRTLHMFARKIATILARGEYHIIISYLEKCELISLNIGTELVLVDNVEINKKATKDALTGALNRHALKVIFETQYEMALATQSNFVLVMSDLDNFKQINDRFGHVIGDDILKLYVSIVKKHIRNSDVIVRYGGEEFVILMPAVDVNKVVEIFETIRKEFAKSSVTYENQAISTTVSTGVLEIRPNIHFTTALINDYLMLADKRLYKAKKEGKNRVVL